MADETIPLFAPSLKGNELKYLAECIETGWISSVGSFVTRFEEAVAKALNVPHAVACVNGTSALHVSLIAAGVEPGDEVIVPTVTFIAPANAVRYVGAFPVFIDCDDRLNLDPEKLKEFLSRECLPSDKGLMNKTTGRRIRAIVPVHVFGHPADLAPVLEAAQKYDLKIIEDATESIGSYYKNLNGGRKYAGAVGDVGCLSFNGNKLITTGGGGMILTSDEKLARRARHLTTQAKEDSLYGKHDEIGYNYRLTNLQAAVGVAQMEQLERFLRIKRENFRKYREALAALETVHLIEEPPYAASNYWHYALVAKNRDGLMEALRKNGIETRPLWHPVHLQKPYRESQAYRIEKATRYAGEVINLPCGVELTDRQIDRVSDAIRKYYGID
jgi:perosamine synthetase